MLNLENFEIIEQIIVIDRQNWSIKNEFARKSNDYSESYRTG